MNFEQVYREHFKKIFAYVCARVADENTAEDICSAIWQKVFDKQDYYDGDKGEILQWLFTVARNSVNSHFRFYFIKNVFSMTDKEEAFASPEKQPQQILEEQERIKLLYNALSGLSQREKDLISLKFYGALNNREISKICGLSESNVGTILNRSMDKMRGNLENL